MDFFISDSYFYDFNITKKDESSVKSTAQNAHVLIEINISGERLEADDSEIKQIIKTVIFVRTCDKISITNKQTVLSDTFSAEAFSKVVDEMSEPSASSTILSVSTLRIPLTSTDRDQLRAMIVLLNESSSVLLKIRQRFSLRASTRCDVIHCQIQMQLQELFGEFRSNDADKFKEMIPHNRDAFLLIWDHLAQLIVDSCYHT